MVSIFRRCHNAYVAFVHGHTPRDLQRVRDRRLQLLAGRMIAKQRKLLDSDQFGLISIHGHARLVVLQCAFHRFVNERDSVARGVLIKQLSIVRAQLHSERFYEFTELCLTDAVAQPHIHYVESMSVPLPKGYGNLYEGIEENSAIKLFLGKLRFNWQLRHYYLTPAFRRCGHFVRKALRFGAAAPP